MYVCYECSFVSEEIYMKDCDQIVWLFLSKKKKKIVIISRFKVNGYVYIDYDYFAQDVTKNSNFSNILTT